MYRGIVRLDLAFIANKRRRFVASPRGKIPTCATHGAFGYWQAQRAARSAQPHSSFLTKDGSSFMPRFMHNEEISTAIQNIRESLFELGNGDIELRVTIYDCNCSD